MLYEYCKQSVKNKLYSEMRLRSSAFPSDLSSKESFIQRDTESTKTHNTNYNIHAYFY